MDRNIFELCVAGAAISIISLFALPAPFYSPWWALATVTTRLLSHDKGREVILKTNKEQHITSVNAKCIFLIHL